MDAKIPKLSAHETRLILDGKKIAAMVAFSKRCNVSEHASYAIIRRAHQQMTKPGQAAH